MIARNATPNLDATDPQAKGADVAMVVVLFAASDEEPTLRPHVTTSARFTRSRRWPFPAAAKGGGT
jgi:hypothetical protein